MLKTKIPIIILASLLLFVIPLIQANVNIEGSNTHFRYLNGTAYAAIPGNYNSIYAAGDEWYLISAPSPTVTPTPSASPVVTVIPNEAPFGSDSDFAGLSEGNFYINIPDGQSLIFQPVFVGDKTNLAAFVAVQTINGTLDGANCYLWFGPQIGGKLEWVAQQNSVIHVTYSPTLIGQVKVNNNAIDSSGTYVAIYAGQTYELTWGNVLATALPIMLIIGIIGLIMLIIGPMYLINKLRQRDLDGLIIGIILCAVGFSLTIAWLWS